MGSIPRRRTVYEDADHIFCGPCRGGHRLPANGTRCEELLEAIGQIVASGSPMSSGMARKVVQSYSSTTAMHPDLAALSPREQSVLGLLSKGYLYKEIAESLSVSGPTVNTYIRRIYDKLQVHSRSQAITKYLQNKTEDVAETAIPNAPISS